MMSDSCSAGFFSKLWSGNLVICNQTFQDYERSSELAGIQSVADSAVKNYGGDSITAQVAQQVATAQQKSAVNDISSINEQIAESAVDRIFGGACDGGPGVDLSIIGGPCLTYSLLKKIGIGVAVVVGLGVILYALGIAKAFIPSR